MPTWTNDPPTKPGLYWFSFDGGRAAPVKVYFRMGQLRARDATDTKNVKISLKRFDHFWWWPEALIAPVAPSKTPKKAKPSP